MLCTINISVFSLVNSFPIVLSVPSPLAQALYLTRQHYRRTVPAREDTNRIIVHTDYPIKIQHFHMLGTNIPLLSTPEGTVLL